MALRDPSLYLVNLNIKDVTLGIRQATRNSKRHNFHDIYDIVTGFSVDEMMVLNDNSRTDRSSSLSRTYLGWLVDGGPLITYQVSSEKGV